MFRRIALPTVREHGADLHHFLTRRDGGDRCLHLQQSTPSKTGSQSDPFPPLSERWRPISHHLARHAFCTFPLLFVDISESLKCCSTCCHLSGQEDVQSSLVRALGRFQGHWQFPDRQRFLSLFERSSAEINTSTYCSQSKDAVFCFPLTNPLHLCQDTCKALDIDNNGDHNSLSAQHKSLNAVSSKMMNSNNHNCSCDTSTPCNLPPVFLRRQSAQGQTTNTMHFDRAYKNCSFHFFQIYNLCDRVRNQKTWLKRLPKSIRCKWIATVFKWVKFAAWTTWQNLCNRYSFIHSSNK